MKQSLTRALLNLKHSHHISCFVKLSYTIIRRSISLELPMPAIIGGCVPADACSRIACVRGVDGFSLGVEEAWYPMATNRPLSGVIARSCIRMSRVGHVDSMLPSRFYGH